jgi:hypothetical protein
LSQPLGPSEAKGEKVAKLLIFVGIALVLVGLAVLAGERFGLGRLPGDIVIERDGFRLYLPLTTSLIVSLVLTLVFWLVGR